MNNHKKNNYWRFILRNSQLPASLQPGQTICLDPLEEDLYHQLLKVFRAEAGDRLVLMNKNRTQSENLEFQFVITEVTKKQLTLSLEKTVMLKDPLKHDLTLALALPNKPAKLDMILEHATELGVTGFVLITTDYSNFHHQVRLDRLEKIIMEAIEQSERARLPSLNMVSGLKDYFQNLSEPCFVALERRSASQNILDLNPATSCHILIGPEGGFSPEEIILIDQSSAAPITLGTQILRNETAALIGAGILSLKLQHRLS